MKFKKWGDAQLILGPGPLGRSTISDYPSWGAFIKGGAVRAAKEGKSTMVYTWQGGNQAAFVLKFYRTLPFPAWWPWLCGRPQRVWPIGTGLEKTTDMVPSHVALVRPASGMTVIITEYLRDAVTFHALATGKWVDKAHFSALGRLMGRLHRLGVVHGDMKWTNIMVTGASNPKDSRFWLIDLDGAFRFRGGDPGSRARDVARFMCDGIKEGIKTDLLDAFRQSYRQDWPIDDGLEKEADRRLARLLKKKGLAGLLKR